MIEYKQVRGVKYFQYKNGILYDVIFPRELKPIPRGRDGTSYVFQCRQMDDDERRPYNIFLNGTLCAVEKPEHLAVHASRELYRILGTGMFSSDVPTNIQDRFQEENKVIKASIRTNILHYALDRNDILFDEPFTVWEFLSAIKGDPKEIFRQLKYCHQKNYLLFDPAFYAMNFKLEYTDLPGQKMLFVAESEEKIRQQLGTSEHKRVPEQEHLLTPHNAAEKVNEKPVFIVHGRDHSVRDSVKGFLDECDIPAIILEKEANSGRTIIEKFEEESDVGFAIAAVTSDDEGRLRGDDKELMGRPRQNVPFEMGYLMRHLGRDRVVLLIRDRDSIEMPSDLSGVLVIDYDDDGLWRNRLAEELKAAGYSINQKVQAE